MLTLGGVTPKFIMQQMQVSVESTEGSQIEKVYVCYDREIKVFKHSRLDMIILQYDRLAKQQKTKKAAVLPTPSLNDHNS